MAIRNGLTQNRDPYRGHGRETFSLSLYYVLYLSLDPSRLILLLLLPSSIAAELISQVNPDIT